MCGSKVRLSIIAETQHSLGRDYGGRPASRQTHALAPARTISVSGAGSIRNAFGQASFVVFQKNHKPMRERRNVASPARTRQPRASLRPRYLGRIQVSETIDLSSAQKSQMDATGLQQAHYAEHVQSIELRQGCSVDRPWCRSILAQEWYGSHHFQITPLHSEHVFSSRPRMRSVAAACQRRQFPHRGFRGQRSRPSVRPECKDDSRCLISSGCQSRSSQAPMRSYAPLDSRGRLSPRGHC